MSKPDVIRVEIRAVLPTNAGSAVFIGNAEKTFVIYVERSVGESISMFIQGTGKPRPLTHDLMGQVLKALGATVERVVINDLKDGVYYARMIISAENEVQQRKIMELDGRPSDCVAMAMQQKAPVFVTRAVWGEVEDMSSILSSMNAQGEDGPEGADEDDDEAPPPNFG